MTKHDFRFTPEDHERMKATLDSLSDNPTEAEAEAVLQACGTSGKEVVNEFIERLLKENLELKQELDRRAAVAGPRGDAQSLIKQIEALSLDDKYNSHYLYGFELCRVQVLNLIKAAAATSSLTPADWFDLALRYMRGDPALTDVPYSDNSVLADFLRFWDAQTPHTQGVVKAVFKASTNFEVKPAPTERTREIFDAGFTAERTEVEGEQSERIKDAIIDGAIGCRNCGDTWERNVSADGIVAPCEDCGDGSYNLAAPTAQPELLKLRQVIGWICDAADAAYLEDSDNKRIHEIFNIAAQAAGLTRRLPDEHGRFDETSIG